MILPLRNDIDEFPHCCMRSLGITCRKCWNLMPSDPASVLGAMPWWWCGRNMVAYISVLTFAAWILTQKKIPMLYLEYRRHWSLVGAEHFSCLDLKSRFWQIKMEEASKQYTAFTVGNLGFFECICMPFGLCNAPATFQWLMQNCKGKLNLIYCLIYLDNLIVFSQITKEHLHQLHVVFDWLWEYDLKLKPSKCSLFKEEINYLAHWVSEQGVGPSNTNLKAITKCTPLQTYMEIQAFLGLIGHYSKFIKDFAWIAQPLNEHLPG